MSTRDNQGDCRREVQDMASLLTQAMLQEAIITVRPGTDHDRSPVTGVIAALRQEQVRLRVNEAQAAAPPQAMPAAVDLELGLADGVYRLQSTLLTVDAGGDWTVAWPQSPARVERRRSDRRAFASGATVEISQNGTGRPRAAAGTLLNLSVDGLACLVDDMRKDEMQVGRIVAARFRPHAAGNAFQLDSRVASNLDAGTQGKRIIGLEFVTDKAYEAARPELVAALTRRDDISDTA